MTTLRSNMKADSPFGQIRLAARAAEQVDSGTAYGTRVIARGRALLQPPLFRPPSAGTYRAVGGKNITNSERLTTFTFGPIF